MELSIVKKLVYYSNGIMIKVVEREDDAEIISVEILKGDILTHNIKLLDVETLLK